MYSLTVRNIINKKKKTKIFYTKLKLFIYISGLSEHTTTEIEKRGFQL